MSREDCLCLRPKRSNRGSLQVGRALACVIAGATLLPWAALQARADQITRGPYLQLTFALPRGAYATNVTREICKSSSAPCE